MHAKILIAKHLKVYAVQIINPIFEELESLPDEELLNIQRLAFVSAFQYVGVEEAICHTYSSVARQLLAERSVTAMAV